METVTGPGAYRFTKDKENLAKETARLLKTTEGNVLEKLKNHLEKEKSLEKELNRLNAEIAKSKMSDEIGEVEKVGDISFVRGSFENVSVEDLRNMAETMRDKNDAVVVLSTLNDDKLNFVCAAPKSAIEKGCKAGNIVKEGAKIAGGGGGGRPDMATAGAKDPSKVKEAINSVAEILQALSK